MAETEPEAPALELRGATKLYGEVRALENVSLAIPPGSTFVLVGESGCGKTTLLRMFNRMVEPTEGTVEVGGVPATERDPVELRRAMGYVQQEAGLLPHWTVQKNVELVPRLLGWDRQRREERSRELLDAVRLDPDRFADRYPGELSGGQRQRVALARALAADPEVVLFDEPLGALDALTRLELQNLISELEEEMGKTLVIVTHDLDEAFRLADRIGVMKEGQLLQVATPDELSANPDPGYVEELLTLRQGGRS